MSKKHFEEIAIAFALAHSEMSDDTSRKALEFMVRQVCSVLRKTNSRFDEQRFLHACGLK